MELEQQGLSGHGTKQHMGWTAVTEQNTVLEEFYEYLEDAPL